MRYVMKNHLFMNIFDEQSLIESKVITSLYEKLNQARTFSIGSFHHWICLISPNTKIKVQFMNHSSKIIVLPRISTKPRIHIKRHLYGMAPI